MESTPRRGAAFPEKTGFCLNLNVRREHQDLETNKHSWFRKKINKKKMTVTWFFGLSKLSSCFTYDEQPAGWRLSHTHVTLVDAFMRLGDIIDDHVTSRLSTNNRVIFVESCWEGGLSVLCFTEQSNIISLHHGEDGTLQDYRSISTCSEIKSIILQ